MDLRLFLGSENQQRKNEAAASSCSGLSTTGKVVISEQLTAPTSPLLKIAVALKLLRAEYGSHHVRLLVQAVTRVLC
jgi:hypothetical protein